MKAWEAHKSQERGIYEVHEKGGNGRICSVTNRSGEEKVAKLIAAAPELLAAGERLRDSLLVVLKNSTGVLNISPIMGTEIQLSQQAWDEVAAKATT